MQVRKHEIPTYGIRSWRVCLRTPLTIYLYPSGRRVLSMFATRRRMRFSTLVRWQLGHNTASFSTADVCIRLDRCLFLLFPRSLGRRDRVLYVSVWRLTLRGRYEQRCKRWDAGLLCPSGSVLSVRPDSGLKALLGIRTPWNPALIWGATLGILAVSRGSTSLGFGPRRLV